MDIFDVAVQRIANDDHNRVPAVELKRRLARLRGTYTETKLEQSADRFIKEVEMALVAFATK